MKVVLYSLRCDGEHCLAEAELVGSTLAAVESRLVEHGRWTVAHAASGSGCRTEHYCPRCSRDRADQAALDALIRAI